MALEGGSDSASAGSLQQVGTGKVIPRQDTPGSLVMDSIHLMDGRHHTLCVSRHLPASLKQSDYHWSLDQFELLDELYKGRTSLLHKAVHKASGQYVAIKQYNKKLLSPLNRYQVEREIQIHINLLHRYIIRLHVAFEDPEQVYLVQEFAPGGDLFEALKHQPCMTFTETEAVARYLAPCLEAMAYLQDRGIVHRDIKPENILIGECGDVKLADFGLAINCKNERPVTRAGTLDYMAPEVLLCPDKKRPDENKDKISFSYDGQVDAWALGCLAAELVTGSPPFEADSKSITYQLIMYREPRLPPHLSQAARSFIAASLVKSSSERFTVEQLLQHEWITSNTSAGAGIGSAAAALTSSGVHSESSSLEFANPIAISGQQSCASNHKSSSSSTQEEAINTVPRLPQDYNKEQDVLTSIITKSTVDLEQQHAAVRNSPASVCISERGSSAGGLHDNGKQATAADCASHPCQSTPNSSPAGMAPATAAPSVPVKTQAPVPHAPSSTQPACLVAGDSGSCEAAAAPDAVQGDCDTANGAARPPRSSSRPSSTHGHHLHKKYYPHDTHRRSSYSNVPWDDFIDTSSHSCTSSASFASTALGGSSTGYEGMMFAAAHTSSGEMHISNDGQPVSHHHAIDLTAQTSTAADAGEEEGRHGLRVIATKHSNSSSSCQGLGRATSQQLVLLAVLPDAELQAPVAVMHEVMAKTASGALHLLAASDLEDLIAPSVASGIALSTLGLAVTTAANMAVRTSSGSFSNHFGGGIDAGAHHEDQSTAAAATQLIGNGDNLDDFIALSAAPGGHVQHSLIVPSRKGSGAAPSLLLSLAASSASPHPSPAQALTASEAVTAVRPSIGSVLSTSPRRSLVRHGDMVGLDPAGRRHGLAPQLAAAGSSKKGSDDICAAAVQCGASVASISMRRALSGVLLSSRAQGQDDKSCTASPGKGATAKGFSRTSSTPNGSKRLVCVAESPVLSARSGIVQTAETATITSCMRQRSVADPAPCGAQIKDETVNRHLAGKMSTSHESAVAERLDLISADCSLNSSAATCSLQQQQQQRFIGREGTSNTFEYATSSAVSGRRRVSSSEGGLLTCATSDQQQTSRHTCSVATSSATRDNNSPISRADGDSSSFCERAMPPSSISGVLALPSSSFKLPALANPLSDSSGKQCAMDEACVADMLAVSQEPWLLSVCRAGDTTGCSATGADRHTGALTPTKPSYPAGPAGRIDGLNTFIGLVRSKSAADVMPRYH